MKILRIWNYSLLLVMLFCAPSLAQTPRPVATITQLKLGKLGDVRVTFPGKEKGKAGGLQDLLPGTRIEVLNDAAVEIYFFSGQTKTITRKESPYEVVLPKRTSRPISTQLIELGKLLVDKKSPRESPGQIRGGDGFLVLAPRRDTRIITRSPQFQWEGAIDPTATLTVSGPKGMVWTTSSLPQDAIEYPRSAPALMPGVYYAWDIELKSTKYSGGRFKILTDDEAGSVKTRLAEIESQSNLGQATRRVLQIGYLISQELYYDARERLIEALKTDGDEPTLRLLLAEVYQKTGLNNLANENAQRASDLATRDKNRE